MSTEKQQFDYIGKVNQEQIDAWKKEFVEVRVIEVVESQPTWKKDTTSNVDVVDVPGKIAIGYLRKPNRIHIARAMVFVNQNQMVEAGESLLDDTWLGGDSRIISIEDKDTDFRVAAAMALSAQTKILDATLKNV